MSIPAVKFNVDDRPEFYQVLRKRVNKHFQENNISKHANFEMIFKTVFMVCLYFVPLALMLTGVVSSLWPVLLMWTLMGFGMSGIGLSVMHDANHGSYSSNKKVNDALGSIIHFIGGYRENWRIQHNVLHHSFTNIEGLDEDIKISFFRFSPDQERNSVHKYQAYYAPFLYALMTLYWSTTKDFEQIIRYKKKDLLKGQGLSYARAFRQVLFNKIMYFTLILILPLILIALPWWQILIGYVIMHFICGLAMAFIFQPAHVITDTHFYDAERNSSMENNWAIHQLKTTTNFANKSGLFSWFVGGLNFQIEHHLFPNICHVHYKKIAKIVKSTTEEFNLPYYQYRTYLGALKGHFSMLNQLGTGTYEKSLVNI